MIIKLHFFVGLVLSLLHFNLFADHFHSNVSNEYFESWQEYFESDSNQAEDASSPASPEGGMLDRFNYAVYMFNMPIDNVLFIPSAFVYEGWFSQSLKDRVYDFAENVNTPYYFINNVMQKNVESSFSSFWRFIINSTLGIFGIFDVASLLDIKSSKQTLGNSLEFYGFPQGEYIILPLVGGVYARDVFSVLGHLFLNPFKFFIGGHIFFNSLDLMLLKHQQLFKLYYVYHNSIDPFYQYKRSVVLERK